jgi:hypothetical protein
MAFAAGSAAYAKICGGKFHFEPPFTSFNNLVGADEQGSRHWGTRVFAALKLMTSSKVVGCSTGRSAGLAPLSIRSTAYVRLRRPSGGTGSSNWSRMIRRLQPRRSRDAVRRSPAQLSAQASRSSPDVQALISSARKRANALSNSLGVWASMMWNCRPSVRIASSVPRIWVAAPGCWD